MKSPIARNSIQNRRSADKITKFISVYENEQIIVYVMTYEL